jgi:hypothetical protein
VRAHYRDEYNDFTGLIMPANAEQMQIVVRAWRKAIVDHPEAYLEHREAVTLRFLGIPNPPHLLYHYGIPQSLYPAYIQNRAYYLRFPTTGVRKFETKLLGYSEYWAFRPWFYVFVSIVVLLLYRRRLGTPFWLCLSGLFYLLPYFFILPSTDFRYCWWTVLAGTTAVALILVQEFEQMQKRKLNYAARFHSGSRITVKTHEVIRG